MGFWHWAARPRAAQVRAAGPLSAPRVRFGFAPGSRRLPTACPAHDRPPALARTPSRPLVLRLHRQPALRLYGGAADTPKPMASAGSSMGDPQSAGFESVKVYSLSALSISLCLFAYMPGGGRTLSILTKLNINIPTVLVQECAWSSQWGACSAPTATLPLTK